jgi:TRAP-type uncharacterized transport system substrate-binding protein
MRITNLIILFGLTLVACNPVTIEFPLIYTSEEPNPQFARQLKNVLESNYNVHIRLVETEHSQAVVDSLSMNSLDMGLIENFVSGGEGINSVIPVYPKVLHLFYRNQTPPSSFMELINGKMLYLGHEHSASYAFMEELLEFYHIPRDTYQITFDKASADVLAIFSILLTDEQLKGFDGFSLYSFDAVDNFERGSEAEGIALKFPRVRPYIIPRRTYGALTSEPVITLATDMMFVVRQGMGQIAVNDLITTMFKNRGEFVHLHPSFYEGLVENFDRAKLNYPLHEGARTYLDRDEPSFFERYAELAGVIFSVVVAIVSGLISLSKWRAQRKKDKVDEFYAHLMDIKSNMANIVSIETARNKIKEIKEEQNRAFNMLIHEELEANDSFRIYMELSKETIQEIAARIKYLQAKQAS